MLIKCPECDLQVSDKAVTCPHCGYPLKSNARQRISTKRFTQVMPGHLPHDPRKTFVTYAKKYKMDEYAIKRIIGHKIKDITEDVYTERSVDWLHDELKKIILYV